MAIPEADSEKSKWQAIICKYGAVMAMIDLYHVSRKQQRASHEKT